MADTCVSGSSVHAGQSSAAFVAVAVALGEALGLADAVTLGASLGVTEGLAAGGVEEQAARNKTASTAGTSRNLMVQR